MSNGNGEGPVLFAYDGSDHAKHAIWQAARELRPGRPAVVLTVWQPSASLALGGAPILLPRDLEDHLLDEARKVADEGASLAREAGFDASPVLAAGEPVWQRIVDTADDYDASLVVLGSHGRTGIMAVLMGSVAAAATRHTDRTVLIVHQPTQRMAS